MKKEFDVSAKGLIPFSCDFVESGATILADGWHGYNDLSYCGYVHNQTILSDSGDCAHIETPGVHRVTALLKRLLLGINQGVTHGKYLDYYLDEYTFRLNRLTSRSRGLLFYRLMEQVICTTLTPYQALVDEKCKI